MNCTNSPDRVVGVVKCTDDSLKHRDLPNKLACKDESSEVVELMVKDSPTNKLVKNQCGVLSLIESDLRLDGKRLETFKISYIKTDKNFDSLSVPRMVL